MGTAASKVDFADAALLILNETCGFRSDASLQYQFTRAITEEKPEFGVEFRFIGELGFGGKFHLHGRSFVRNGADSRCYVSCYPEDRTPEREAMIAAANERLSRLADDFTEAFVVPA